MSLTVKHVVLKLVTVFAAAGAIALSGSLPAHAATHVTVSRAATHVADSDFFGCPSGAVCIYQDDNPDHLSSAFITNAYFSYGAHNLVNQFNNHWVLNNQFGGPNATAVLCFGYNGVNCTGDVIPPGFGFIENLTPINSIVLNRP